MRAVRSVLLALALLAPVAAGAVQPDEVMKDPAMESRARSISAGLRCLSARTSRSTIPTRRSPATCG